MTPDVRIIMPCTQLNLSNSRLKVPFVKSAHIYSFVDFNKSSIPKKLKNC